MGGAEYRAAECNAIDFAREKTLEEELHGRQTEQSSFRPFLGNGNIAVIFQGFRRYTACVPLTDSDEIHMTSHAACVQVAQTTLKGQLDRRNLRPPHQNSLHLVHFDLTFYLALYLKHI